LILIRRIARFILPAGSRQRIIAGRFKNLLLHGTWGPGYKYKIWIKKYEPLTLQPVMVKQTTKISIVVPAFNTRSHYIKELINSVLSQTYQNWELCIADGSTDAKRSEEIKDLCTLDNRIKYIKVSGNLGISGNTNEAIKQASGRFVAFLDHDDILPTWSLNELAVAIKANPKSQIFYSDEDRLTENGKSRMSPFLKPDWSADLFLSANYVAHFFVIGKSLLDDLGGLRSEYDGSQDYDLMLRALDRRPIIIHVPKILYHMRMAKGSTARSIGEKDYADDAGRRAIADYFRRNKILAGVSEIEDRPTNYRISYNLDPKTLVSVIIPFKDKSGLLKACLSSIEAKTTHSNYELILISNNSQESETEKYLERIKNRANVSVYRYDKPFNYSALNNFGRKKARGEVLIFLNNDTEVISPEWMSELAAAALRPEIGAAGPLLLYPDKTIQHAGVVLGLTGMAGHIFRELKPGTLTPFWLPDWPRDFLAVTGACLAVEASKFDRIKGFREEFIMAGSDVVFCLDLIKVGYRNLYWPFAVLMHHESKSVISY
jgi:glycosyltransferase involved in cell wall biosynthesis